MAEQFYTLLTKVGKAKIANASALGTKLNLSKFQVGDSNGSYYNPTEEQTELKNKVWEGVISSITVDENNPNWIVLQTILPGNIGGFMIREAGVFDSEGNLIAIGKYPETYKPQSGDGSTKDLVIKMILEVSNASSITLKVDPTVILATKKDIEILENKIKNIKIPVASVNNKTGAVELSASDVGAYSKTEVDNKIKDITVPVTKVNGKTGDVILSATDIKTTDGKTVESQLVDNTKEHEDLHKKINSIQPKDLDNGRYQADFGLDGAVFTNIILLNGNISLNNAQITGTITKTITPSNLKKWGNAKWTQTTPNNTSVVCDILNANTSVPSMISNTAPSGMVSSSTYNDNQSYNMPYLAFDNDQYNTGWTSQTATNEWLKYQFTKPKIISSYGLKCDSNSPKNWKLQGSNDNSTWVDIHTITNEPVFPSEGETRIYNCNNNMAYSYYRLYITTGYTTVIRIKHCDLYEQIKSNITSLQDLSDIDITQCPLLKVRWTLTRNTINDTSPTVKDVSITYEGKSNGYEKIGEINLNGLNSFEFNNIPSKYMELLLICEELVSYQEGVGLLEVTINKDRTGVYGYKDVLVGTNTDPRYLIMGNITTTPTSAILTIKGANRKTMKQLVWTAGKFYAGIYNSSLNVTSIEGKIPNFTFNNAGTAVPKVTLYGLVG